MEAQQRNLTNPISPQVKTADFNVPKRIFQYDDGYNTGYFHTADNKAMKTILHLFNSFLTGICQIVFNPIQDSEAQNTRLLVCLNTFDFQF